MTSLSKSAVASAETVDAVHRLVLEQREVIHQLQQRVDHLEHSDHAAELAFRYAVLVLLAASALTVGALTGQWGWLVTALVVGFWVY